MRRTRIVLLVSIASLGAAQNIAPQDRDRFVGVWRLVSFERHYTGGKVEYPMGRNAAGRITYDKVGRMSAQLMNPDRPKPAYPTTPGGVRSASADEMRSVLIGFTAYYGTFDVDESNRTVIHHVKSHLNPSLVGTDLKRTYQFSGKRLTLTVAYADGSGVLVWEREPD